MGREGTGEGSEVNVGGERAHAIQGLRLDGRKKGRKLGDCHVSLKWCNVIVDLLFISSLSTN